MNRKVWKGISSLARPSNCPRSTLTYRCVLPRASKENTRQLLLTARMPAQRPFSAGATSEVEMEADCDARYRPFLLEETTKSTDWISELELDTAVEMTRQNIRATGQPLRVLVLYGSLRKRYDVITTSKKVARANDDADVRLQVLLKINGIRSLADSPSPGVRCPCLQSCSIARQERLRREARKGTGTARPESLERRPCLVYARTAWESCGFQIVPTNGQQSADPAQTGVFKNQIDWIPLSAGSVRPTQGRTLSVIQVNGGSQSFNAVNSLRILGRWMRMFCIPNQSSLPKAYTQFTDEGDETSRLLPGGNRDRLVDCMEEFVKYTIVMRPHFELFGDRFSERSERRAKAAKEAAAAEKLSTTAASALNGSAIAGVDTSAQRDGDGKDSAGADIVNGVNVVGI